MNTGDKVVIEDDEDAPGDWGGITGTLLKVTNFGGETDWAKIQPDVDRPDEYGKEWFFWPIELTKLKEA
jgi:hypothetical protein